MPYIKQDRRAPLWAYDSKPQNAGELNYLITKFIDEYLKGQGEVRYAHLNEVIGVLECAKLELYRRVVSPYEDTKIVENGDVYTGVVSKPQT